MIKGGFEINISGPSGSGKTNILKLIKTILETFGYIVMVDDENHQLSVIRKVL